LSRFVPENEFEAWEIAAALEDDYERANAGSFPVYVAPEFRHHDKSLLKQCLRVLEENARQVEEALPASAWQKISAVPIWLEFEPDRSYGGAYFPSWGWLVANGMTGAKAKSIQFTSSLPLMERSTQNPLMHELAHAYHDLVLSFSYAPILSQYHGAQLSGRYNAVRHSSGRIERAYAMQDHMEFFAQLSEAYFGTSGVFPFTREDLKEFDPGSFRVISKAWERPFEGSSGRPTRREIWMDRNLR
jgi:dipeptidyl-peptidase-4